MCLGSITDLRPSRSSGPPRTRSRSTWTGGSAVLSSYTTMCVYTCMYVCMYVCIYIYIYMNKYINYYVRICVYIYTHTCACTISYQHYYCHYHYRCHYYAHHYYVHYGQFSEFQICFCGLDPGNLKFETVPTHKRHVCF